MWDNSENSIIRNKQISVGNILCVVVGSITFIGSAAAILRVLELTLKTTSKKTKYDRLVKKILREYDRLIVENATGPDTKTTNVIKISKFEELLDVRDNLKLPIMYYVITKHTKCCFYIKHNRDLYLMVVKAVDLEENN